MMRVLHLTDSWGPGGAETVYADLATGLDGTRFQSFAGLPRASDWLYNEMLRRGANPFVFPSSGAFDIRHVARLVRRIREAEINVVQAHTFGTSVYASLAGAIARVPVVSTLHGRVDIALEDRRRRIKWGMIRVGSDRVVCVSESLRRELVNSKAGVSERQLAVIHNGVDTARFRPGRDEARRRELGVGAADILIGAVGNVRRVKGYEVLLSASAILAARGMPIRVVIVGQADGAAYEELVRMRGELGLDDRVTFAGFRSDVPEYFRAFDIYAITSHSEGFPLSTIQALASGLPVVATRCGGPEEMVDEGVHGWLADAGSGEAVAEALGRLVSDEAARRRMGGAARAMAVARFSTATMVSQYEALYELLANGPGYVPRRTLESVQEAEHGTR